MSEPSTTILSVRVSANERALLEAAAEQASTSLSDFVRRKSLEAAEVDVLARSVVTIPAKDWGEVRILAARQTPSGPWIEEARCTEADLGEVTWPTS